MKQMETRFLNESCNNNNEYFNIDFVPTCCKLCYREISGQIKHLVLRNNKGVKIIFVYFDTKHL